MDLKQYDKLYGRRITERLAQRCGAKASYVRHMVAGRTIPSPKLAVKLVEESGGELDFWSLFTANDHEADVTAFEERAAKYYRGVTDDGQFDDTPYSESVISMDDTVL